MVCRYVNVPDTTQEMQDMQQVRPVPLPRPANRSDQSAQSEDIGVYVVPPDPGRAPPQNTTPVPAARSPPAKYVNVPKSPPGPTPPKRSQSTQPKKARRYVNVQTDDETSSRP